jgi:hypothetical protein
MVYLDSGCDDMRKMFLSAIASWAIMIKSYDFLLDARKSSEHFSRKGELGFVNTVQSTLNFNNHSQQLELDNYLELTESNEYFTQQAYSKARQQIKPEAFKQLFDVTVDEAAANREIETLNGYTPIAIDGTTLALDNLPELITYFGCSGSKVNACTARVSVACDTQNGIVYDAAIEPYNVGERKLAIQHIENIIALNLQSPLFILDRGYVSNFILAMINDAGEKYIMRIRKGWHSTLVESTQSGDWASFSYKGKTYNVRIIKILLDTGEEEVLFTNLSEFSPTEFKQLYFMRWPVETKYDVIKNKLMLENFTGKTETTIKQDFWAVMALSNLAAFAKMEADEMIAEIDSGKDLKYKNQANTNALIGKLKNKLILMLLTDNPSMRERIFDHIVRRIANSYKVPIRPDRKVSRKPPRKNKRFNQCTKKSL